MQALAMCRQLALLVGKASSRGEIALAVLPNEMVLAALLDAAFLVVVVWVVGAPLAVQLPTRCATRFVTEQ